MFGWRWLPLTVSTAVAPGLPWLLIWRARNAAAIGRGSASLLGLVQFAVLGVNAISRQVVQNFELSSIFLRDHQQTAKVQWSPLLAFLVMFVLGLAVVAWMIFQVAKLPPESPDAA